jgi:molybdopterin synthase catalytic subunit
MSDDRLWKYGESYKRIVAIRGAASEKEAVQLYNEFHQKSLELLAIQIRQSCERNVAEIVHRVGVVTFGNDVPFEYKR